MAEQKANKGEHTRLRQAFRSNHALITCTAAAMVCFLCIAGGPFAATYLREQFAKTLMKASQADLDAAMSAATRLLWLLCIPALLSLLAVVAVGLWQARGFSVLDAWKPRWGRLFRPWQSIAPSPVPRMLLVLGLAKVVLCAVAAVFIIRYQVADLMGAIGAGRDYVATLWTIVRSLLLAVFLIAAVGAVLEHLLRYHYMLRRLDDIHETQSDKQNSSPDESKRRFAFINRRNDG